jgi:hypothetical protein
MPASYKLSLPFGISDQRLVCNFIYPVHATFSAHFILLDLIRIILYTMEEIKKVLAVTFMTGLYE